MLSAPVWRTALRGALRFCVELLVIFALVIPSSLFAPMTVMATPRPAIQTNAVQSASSNEISTSGEPVVADTTAPVESASQDERAEAATNPEVAPNEAEPLLPATAALEVDHPVVSIGETDVLTLTVTAWDAQSEGALAGLVVTLTLPAGLVTSAGQRGDVVWSDVAVGAGAPFVQVLGLQLDQQAGLSGQEVLNLTAAVAASGYTLSASELLLGAAVTPPSTAAVADGDGVLVESHDGELALLAPEGVLPAGAALQLTELFDGQAAMAAAQAEQAVLATAPLTSTIMATTPVTTTGAVTATSPVSPTTGANNAFAIYLPFSPREPDAPAATDPNQPTSPGNLITPQPGEVVEPFSACAAFAMQTGTRQDANLLAYRIWQLDASQNGARVATFDGEVQLTVSIADWLNLGINPDTLRLWTRETGQLEWRTVRTAFDPEQQTLTAWLPHFSQFGLGAALDPSGDMLPSVHSFTVDELNGGSSVHLPIETPKGLGGLTPNLSFDYSSITMDDMLRVAGSHEIQTQASAVGIGWHLGGVSYIARTDAGEKNDDLKEFALVLNGSSMAIVKQGGRWRTNPETFARIEWTGGDNGTGYEAKDYAGWTVFTADGMQYEFGDAQVFPGVFDATRPTATFLAKSPSLQEDIRLAKRWYLRKVTDPNGNMMEYLYHAEQGTETGCVADSWKANKAWYARSVDLTNVLWGKNSSQSTGYTMQVSLNYTSRTDTIIKGTSTTDCLQPLYGSNNKLTSVAVQVWNNGGWQTLRSYQLTQTIQDYSPNSTPLMRRLRLEKIEQYGKGGTTLFSRNRFTYEGNDANLILLKTADNGVGGKVTYDYDQYSASCDMTSTCAGSGSVPRNIRHAVIASTATATNTTSTAGPVANVRTEYYYGHPIDQGGEWSAIANDGGFLGFKEVDVSYYDVDTAGGALLKSEVLKSVGNSAGADAHRDNPDPRRGKLGSRTVYAGAITGAPLATYVYDWKAVWLLNNNWDFNNPRDTSWYQSGSTVVFPVTWLQLIASTTTITNNNIVVSNAQITTYEANYGNAIAVEERANNVLQRITQTEYYPKLVTDGNGVVTAYMANRPARVRVFASDGACKSETRWVYDHYDATNSYNQPPARGLVSEKDVAIGICSDTVPIATTDNNWMVERFAYDTFGNETVYHLLAGSDGSQESKILTVYDTNYFMFPVRQYYSQNPSHEETAAYYGVNAISSGENKALTDAWAYWGMMAEHCGVNDVCTRQAYDAHGRRTNRWDNVASGTAWSGQTAINATVAYGYRDPLNNPGDLAIMQSEWQAPRCYGNFVRKRYNAFGQLIQAQTADQGWQINTDNCGPSTPSLPEIDVDHAYDGLGREVRVSVPHGVTVTWLNRAADFSLGQTVTAYDALDRTTLTTAPNGEQTVYSYTGRATKATAIGRNGDPNKVVSWTEVDGLGNLSIVRTGNSAGTEIARVTLTNDVMGNLTRVVQTGVNTATMTYDLAGNKVKMDDPDLGEWYYQYDRQGKLVRQTDACGNITALTYDNMGRVTQKALTKGATCNVADGYDTVNYAYGSNAAGEGSSRGQLVKVWDNDTSYRKTFVYDALGRVKDEGVYITASYDYTYTTSYEYDAYQRLATTIYPDGDRVTVDYDSRGLAVRLSSNQAGVLVNGAVSGGPYTDAVAYDAAGRPTQMRFPAGGNTWWTQVYNPWVPVPTDPTNSNSNGRPWYELVGKGQGSGDLYMTYLGWDSFGNLTGRSEFVDGLRRINHNYQYDNQNRLDYATHAQFDFATGTVVTATVTSDFGYDNLSRPTTFENNAFTVKHGHFSAPAGHAYTFDADGNVRTRPGQSLTWDAENRLAKVTWGAQWETYLYDENGQRIQKVTSSGEQTNYYFPHFEVTNGVATKYYLFNGRRIAMRVSSLPLRYLYSDYLGSSVLETDASAANKGEMRYTAYGRSLPSSGLGTDYLYTGQMRDDTGLYYMNARYYDPTLGQFISPDTIVPEPGQAINYNRHLYANANPLKFNDPSGHCAWDLCLSEGYAVYVLAGVAIAAYAAYDYQYIHGPNAEENREAVAQSLSDLATGVSTPAPIANTSSPTMHAVTAPLLVSPTGYSLDGGVTSSSIEQPTVYSQISQYVSPPMPFAKQNQEGNRGLPTEYRPGSQGFPQPPKPEKILPAPIDNPRMVREQPTIPDVSLGSPEDSLAKLRPGDVDKATWLVLKTIQLLSAMQDQAPSR